MFILNFQKISQLVIFPYSGLQQFCSRVAENSVTRLWAPFRPHSIYSNRFVCLFFRDGWGNGYAFERVFFFCLWFAFVRFVPSDEFCFYYWAQLRQCLIQKKLLRSRNPHRKIFSDRLIVLVGKIHFLFRFC